MSVGTGPSDAVPHVSKSFLYNMYKIILLSYRRSIQCLGLLKGPSPDFLTGARLGGGFYLLKLLRLQGLCLTRRDT